MQAQQNIQVENTGDVGTKFAVDVAALGPHFAVFPASGFLAPNQQAQVEVTFQPKALHPDIRVDKVCRVSACLLLCIVVEVVPSGSGTQMNHSLPSPWLLQQARCYPT